jgi:hypothetical protein
MPEERWTKLKSLVTSRQAGRRLILPLAVLVVAIAVIWVLERFLNKAGGSWNEAIALFSTMALLGVTTAYVYLTYRILQVQEKPLRAIRLAAQEQHVHELIRILARKSHAAASLASLFPLDQTDREGAFDVLESEDSTEAISSLSDDLNELASVLPPALRPALMKTLTILLLAHNCHQVLRTGVLKEQNVVLREDIAAREQGRSSGRKATWEGARSIYYLQERDGVTGKPEWNMLVNGELWKRADKALDELNDQAGRYLQTPTS